MNLDAALQRLSQEPNAPLDLAELALHLARDEYPDLDVEAYLQQLDGMAHEVRRYLRGHDLPVLVERFRRYLFLEMGFRGNVRNYYDPRNSYLNDVLERRTGIPITLSAVAIAVGCRAGLDIQGVGLPGHFIVKASGGRLPDHASQEPKPPEEIFFDPFHGGRILSLTDCEILVQQVTRTPFKATPETLQATPLQLILVRMLNNLRAIYMQRLDLPRCIRILERLRQLQPKNAELHRDLGICLVQVSQPGRAIDHLTFYLRSGPVPADAEEVQTWLKKAQDEVARWN